MTAKSTQADRLRAIAEKSKARKAATTTETTHVAAAVDAPLDTDPADVSAEPRRSRNVRPADQVSAPLAKPVRSTVDLPPARHAALKSWCGEAAVDLGRSRVTTQDVFRAFVNRLLTDETFARKIRSDLRDQQ
jgi:hypothetical protein